MDKTLFSELMDRIAGEKTGIDESSADAGKLFKVKKDFLDSEISLLKQKLRVGEDVEDKLQHRIRERWDLEMSNLETVEEEMKRKGKSREYIQEYKESLKRKILTEKDSAERGIPAAKAMTEHRRMMSLERFLQYQFELFYGKKPSILREVETGKAGETRKRETTESMPQDEPDGLCERSNTGEKQEMKYGDIKIVNYFNINGKSIEGNNNEGIKSYMSGKSLKIEIPEALIKGVHSEVKPLGRS